MGGARQAGLKGDAVDEADMTTVDFPSFADLRRGASDPRPTSVLDEVLYGLPDTGEGTSHSWSQDIRRDIVDSSVRIVAVAAADSSAILDAPVDVHGGDTAGGPAWPQRFAAMVESVNPIDAGVATAADIVAQCAKVPPGLEKLVSAMASTVVGRLTIDPTRQLATIRSHMINAGFFADIAWCAAHGELGGCHSWQLKREEMAERVILTELRRFSPSVPGTGPNVPPERDRASAAAKGTSEVPAPVEDSSAVFDSWDFLWPRRSQPQQVVSSAGAEPPDNGQAVLPDSIVEVVNRLLADGRWPTTAQRTIATKVRNELDRYRSGDGHAG